MRVPNSIQVLKLYKDLLRYGQDLQFTDKQYFYRRIKKEFKKNKTLTEPKDISFNYEKGKAVIRRLAVI